METTDATVARIVRLCEARKRVLHELTSLYGKEYVFSARSQPGVDDWERFYVRRAGDPNQDRYKTFLGQLSTEDLLRDDCQLSTAELIAVVDELGWVLRQTPKSEDSSQESDTSKPSATGT